MAFTNNDTLLQDLIAGTIDGGVDLTPTQMKQLESEPTITARAITVDGFDDLGFNCYDGPSKGHPVLKDVKFRQAVNWAVDRDKIVSLVWGGTTTPGTTIIPPNYYTDPDWHWEPPAETAYKFDPAKAGQLLDEAGYTDGDGDGIREYKGKNIELGLIAREESVQSQMTGKLIAGWFGDVGIKVNLEVMDEATLGDRELNYEGDVFTPDFDMFLWGWYLDYDPGSMLSYMTKSQIEQLERDLLDRTRSTTSSTSSRARSSTRPSARRSSTGCSRSCTRSRRTSSPTTRPDFEAYNTTKWDGYIADPEPERQHAAAAVRQRGLRQLHQHPAQGGRDGRGERQLHGRLDRGDRGRRRAGDRRGRRRQAPQARDRGGLTSAAEPGARTARRQTEGAGARRPPPSSFSRWRHRADTQLRAARARPPAPWSRRRGRGRERAGDRGGRVGAAVQAAALGAHRRDTDRGHHVHERRAGGFGGARRSGRAVGHRADHQRVRRVRHAPGAQAQHLQPPLRRRQARELLRLPLRRALHPVRPVRAVRLGRAAHPRTRGGVPHGPDPRDAHVRDGRRVLHPVAAPHAAHQGAIAAARRLQGRLLHRHDDRRRRAHRLRRRAPSSPAAA